MGTSSDKSIRLRNDWTLNPRRRTIRWSDRLTVKLIGIYALKEAAAARAKVAIEATYWERSCRDRLVSCGNARTSSTRPKR